MTRRSPVQVLILSLITCGIYSWYWLVKTKTELNQRGGQIPTAWIWLVPVVGFLYWLWKFSEAAEQVTKGVATKMTTFLLNLFVGFIGEAVLQGQLNDVA